MNELQRQAYMEAMGVDCYMPRLQLPGAMASVLCDMPVVELPAETPEGTTGIDAQVDGQAHVPAPNNASGSAAAMQALLGAEAVTTTKKAVEVADVVEALKSDLTVPKQQVPQFSLSVIRGANIVLLDEGLTPEINPAEYLHLIENILFALGAGRQTLSIDAFVWPMIKNSQIDQSETAARQTLSAFISKQIQQLGAKYVVAMGATSAKYLCDSELPAGQLIDHPLLSVQLIGCSSAARMLTEPLTKRTAWRELQPLHQALRAG